LAEKYSSADRNVHVELLAIFKKLGDAKAAQGEVEAKLKCACSPGETDEFLLNLATKPVELNHTTQSSRTRATFLLWCQTQPFLVKPGLSQLTGLSLSVFKTNFEFFGSSRNFAGANTSLAS